MPSEKSFNTAIAITGSRATKADIDIQYDLVSTYDKFLLSNSIEKILRTHNVMIDEGWRLYRDDIENLALDYLIDPATAYCLYCDWKTRRKRD